jgi:hypothetical protein
MKKYHVDVALELRFLSDLVSGRFLYTFIFIWFVRLLGLRPLLVFVPASGDSEDDCGEADGM